MDLSDELGSFFTEKALGVLGRAVSQSAPGRPAGTLDVFLAAMELDATAEWQRIWLHFRAPVASDPGRYHDPLPYAGDWWDGRPVTATCARAIRAAVALADGSSPRLVPVPVGVLALCLAGEPATAASSALGATSAPAHAALLELLQETLVEGHWDDLTSVLADCFCSSAPGAPGWLDRADPDVQRFLDYHADRLQTLIDVLNQFLKAASPDLSGALIEEHPELLSVQVDKIIEKSIQDAERTLDAATVRHLRERQRFLQACRQLIDRPPREIAGTERLGETTGRRGTGAGPVQDQRDVPARPGQSGVPAGPSALEERMRRLQARPEPDLVLEPDAVADAAELLDSVGDLRSHGRLLLMAGGLHFMRWTAHQDRGEDRQEELMVAMALFAPLRDGREDLLDRRFRNFLKRERRQRPQPGDQPASTALRAYLNAAPPANQAWADLLWQVSLLLYSNYQREGQEAVLSEAIALLRHAVKETPAEGPGYPERAAALYTWLLVRHRITGAKADLYEALGMLRSGTAGTLAGPGLRQGLLSARGTALDLLFDTAGDLDALDAAIRAHRTALRDLSVDDPGYGRLALRLAAALLRHHRRTGQAGSLEEAVGTLHDAQAAAARHGERAPGVLAGLANNTSVAYTAQYERTKDETDLDRAIAEGERAVSLADDDADRAAAHGTLGIALMARYARYANVDPASLPFPADAVEMLGDFLDEALEHLRAAVRLTPGNSPQRATASANLGIGLLRAREAGAPPDTLREAREAFDAVAVGTAGTEPVRALACLTAGRLAADDGDWPVAAGRLESAIDLLEVAVPRGLRRQDREYRLSLLRDLGCDAAACAWRSGDTGRAVSLFERGRGVLLAQETGAPTELERLRVRDSELAGDFRDLLGEMEGAERYDLVSDPSDWSERTAAEKRADLRVRWDALLARIRAEEGFREFLKPPDTANLLNSGRAGPVVLLNVSRYGSAAFILRDGTVAVVELPGLTPARVRALVAELLTVTDLQAVSALDAQPRLVRLLGCLWDEAAGPVLDHLGITGRLGPEADGPRIWWCPAGLLSFLPLHAAGHHDTRSDDRPRTVTDRVVSSYTPTLRVLERDGQAARRAPGRLLIVAPGNAGTAGLGLASDEGRAPGRDAPGGITVLAGPAATPAGVLSALPGHSRVHFACHAASDLNDPSAGYLELHGRVPLAVSAITALHLSDAEFAFLGACSTYQGGATLADEALHLGGAFLLAGYRQVIATLWPIKDTRPAARVTRAVHEAVSGPGGPAAALHAATRRERDRAPDAPSLWAPYVHSGG
jgi:tetratricopeptide (TPR) repeat protein